MDTAVDSIVVINESGIIRCFNPAAERLFGYGEDEAVGVHVDLLMVEHEKAEHRRSIARYVATGEKHIIGIGREVEGLRKDGSRVPIYLAVSEFAMPTGRYFIGVMRDISANLELRELHDRLADIGRLSAMAETTAAIAHELSQPLAAVGIYAQVARDLLDRAPAETARLAETLDKVTAQALRAGEVMERVQRLIRGLDGRYEAADVNALMRDVVELARVDARRREIVIDFDPAPGLPSVDCDPVQIQQVGLNLLRNAIDATVADGARHGNAVRVSTGLVAPGVVRIDVADAGPGVPAGTGDELFTPFHTSKAKGLGVGLAICRTIVLNHRGGLDYENNIDSEGEVRGATFSVTLPVEAEDEWDEREH